MFRAKYERAELLVLEKLVLSPCSSRFLFHLLSHFNAVLQSRYRSCSMLTASFTHDWSLFEMHKKSQILNPRY